MTQVIKARHWGLVVYPESAPADWIDLIEKSKLAFAVSPLHDKDLNPDGEIKKPHWHVILSWDGPVRVSVPTRIAKEINSPIPVKLESVRGAYRYFTHMDNPDKYQYDEKEILIFNGFDISQYIAMTKEEKYQAISDIMDIINERCITEYLELLIVLREEKYELFKVASDNTILVNALVRSARHRGNSK